MVLEDEYGLCISEWGAGSEDKQAGQKRAGDWWLNLNCMSVKVEEEGGGREKEVHGLQWQL